MIVKLLFKRLISPFGTQDAVFSLPFWLELLFFLGGIFAFFSVSGSLLLFEHGYVPWKLVGVLLLLSAPLLAFYLLIHLGLLALVIWILKLQTTMAQLRITCGSSLFLPFTFFAPLYLIVWYVAVSNTASSFWIIPAFLLPAMLILWGLILEFLSLAGILAKNKTIWHPKCPPWAVQG